MSLPQGAAMWGGALLSLGLAACVATQSEQSGEPPYRGAEIETRSENQPALPSNAAAQPPMRAETLSVEPAWLRRIDTSGAAIDDGQTQFTVSSVQPLFQTAGKVDTLFTQVRIEGIPRLDEPSGSSNLNLGYRRIIGNDLLVGGAGFYDHDLARANERAGASAELKWRSLDFTANYYRGLDSRGEHEHALDGYSFELQSQIPFLPWGRARLSSADFFSTEESFVNSYNAGLTLDLTRYLRMQMDMRSTGEAPDVASIKLTFDLLSGHRQKPSTYAFSADPFSDSLSADRPMGMHTLGKVARSNVVHNDG